MKNLLKTALICVLALISSCTIQKRTFQPGYHIEWKKNHQSKTECSSDATAQLKPVISTPKKSENSPVSASITELSSVDNNQSQQKFTSNLNSTSDVVLLTSETEEQQITLNKTINEKVNSNPKVEFTKIKKVKRASEHSVNGGKLQIVALILCIVLGLIGVHRFYLGYTGMGILYLLTFGLFGIGWLIDIILLIIPNGLTPKGKTNYKK